MRLDANARMWNGLGLLLFAGMMVSIFWEVLPWFLAPLAPDAMPFFPFGNRTVTLDNLLVAGGEFTPQHLYWLIFNPLLANKLTYMIDTLMLALAGVYYLRSRGVSRPAAWIGGLALGFSGYSFTLFSAGHRGYFHMMGCAVFSFGLLSRGFRDRRWFHFAMLGACLAWGIPYQADVLVMVFALAAAYTLWLTLARGVDVRTPWQRVVQVYPRFLLTLLVAAAIAWPGIQDVLGRQISGRKEQISSFSGPVTAGTADTAGQKRDQWIFATNWSLPPADLVEFVVPGIYGNDSMQPPYPYWGALGRPYDWEPGQRVMPNYRQHTVYLGVFSVCFALFAGLLWWRTRRKARPQLQTNEGGAGGPALPAGDETLADVPFWLGAGVVCLLLALGRYTPFYRLFYAIPYLDLIRAPVKIHHLVEICTAFLCGLGVEMWWRGAVVAAPAKRGAIVELPAVARVGRWLAMLAAGMAGVLLMAAGMVASSSAAIAAHIGQLGLGAYGESLAGYAVENLVRAAVVFGIAALLFWLGRPRAGRNRPATWLLVVLALALAVDLVTVAQRYVRPINMQPFYARHAVLDAIAAQGGINAGVANYLTDNDPTRDWFAGSLWSQGLRLALAPDTESEKTFIQAIGKRSEVLWRALHARYVIAPWKSAAALVKAQTLEPLVSFTLGQGTVLQAQPSADSDLLAAFTGALPAAYVVDRWQGGMNTNAQMQLIGRKDWDPARTTLCDAIGSTGGESRVIGQARVIQQRGLNFRLTTKLDVDAPQAGLLVLDEKYADDLLVRVDEREAPVHCANVILAAVEVPAGHHVVTVRHRPHLLPVLFTCGAGLLVGLWGAVRWALRKSC